MSAQPSSVWEPDPITTLRLWWREELAWATEVSEALKEHQARHGSVDASDVRVRALLLAMGRLEGLAVAMREFGYAPTEEDRNLAVFAQVPSAEERAARWGAS